MWRVLAIFAVSATANADPDPYDLPPPDPPGRFEGALHVGMHDTHLILLDGHEQDGSGQLVDAELGWRRGIWSIGGFGAYATMVSALGGRTRFYLSRTVFLGAGMAAAELHDTWTPSVSARTITGGQQQAPVDDRSWRLMIEASLGFATRELPRCHFAIEGTVTYATFSEYADASSLRVALGVRFR
jgi:hypothetical protein